MNCKNLFSYPPGTIFSGADIIKFIEYHCSHRTGKTKVARYMKKKFSSICANKQYAFFPQWVCAESENVVNKPRLLRTDHQPPIARHYDWFDNRYTYYSYRGREILDVNPV